MYQRILLPIDDSAAAMAAFAEALQLAQCTSAQLLLVHVLDVSRSALAPMGMPGMEYATYQESRQENGAQREHFLHDLSEQAAAAGVPCSSKLIEKWGGNPAKTLLAEADAWQADLIVMGTHGNTGLMHLIFGSVAENLLHHSKVPVLLLRKEEDVVDD